MKKTIIYSLFVTFAVLFTALSVDMVTSPVKAQQKTVTIQFKNNTDGPVQLYWEAGNNKLKLYATIQPGATHSLLSYVSHRWALYKSGALIQRYTANGQATQVTQIGTAKQKAIARPGKNAKANLVAVWQYHQSLDGNSYYLNTDGSKSWAGWKKKNDALFFAYKSSAGKKNLIPIYRRWAKNTTTNSKKYTLSRSPKTSPGWTTESRPVFYLSLTPTAFPIYKYTANGGTFGYRQYFTTLANVGHGWTRAPGVFAYAAGIPKRQAVKIVSITPRKITQADLIAVWQYHETRDGDSFYLNTDGTKSWAGWTKRKDPVFLAYKSGTIRNNLMPIYRQWANNQKTNTKKYALSKSPKSGNGWTTESKPLFYLSSTPTAFPIYKYTASGGTFGFREYYSTSATEGSGWKKSAGVFGYAAGMPKAKAVSTRYKNASIKIGQYSIKNGDPVIIRDVATGWNWSRMYYINKSPAIVSSNTNLNKDYNKFILEIVDKNKFRLKNEGTGLYASLICCSPEFGNAGDYSYLTLNVTKPSVFTSFPLQNGTVRLTVDGNNLGRECCVPDRGEITSIAVANGKRGRVSAKERFLVIPWNVAWRDRGSNLHSYSDRKKRSYTANWMGYGRSWLKNTSLNKIVFPGSHDSGMYNVKFSPTKGLAADKKDEGIKHGSFFLAGTIANWAQTQRLNIRQQLESGVRYIDLRVCFKKSATPYLCHAIYAGKLLAAVLEIKSFATSHPSEVIIVDIQHVYTFHDNFSATEKSNLGIILDRLKARAIGAGLTASNKYGQVIRDSSSGNLIVLMKTYTNAPSNTIRPSWVKNRAYWVCDGWTGSDSKSAKIADIEKKVQECSNSSRFKYLPFAVTASTGRYAEGAFSSLSSFAKKTNPVLSERLVNKWSRQFPSMNIISADYIDRTCLIDLAIQMNNPKRRLAGLIPQSLTCTNADTGW